MTRVPSRRSILTWCAAGAIAGAIGTSSARAQRDTAGDEAAIRDVMSRGADAFNRGDAAGAAAIYADDADLVNVRGDHLKGAAEIEQGLARAFATRYKDARIKRGEVAIRFLRPDVALAHVTNEITGGAGSAEVHRELGLRVFVKEGSAWRIAALHNTPIVPR